ncbi:MAG: dienelactone hydrolase family protein [Betaproteobacteria bacterium]|nr:dienelactone hydrolase family protein [Betaproteobacteria bacterium]MDH3437771.1 dienelactone hydrolase family protein [Betaproteobacteria bacterium]
MGARPGTNDVTVQAANAALEGTLVLPQRAAGIVVFAHGSGSSRFSPRNQYVSDFLNEGGLGTLLFDLLTAEEHEIDELTRELRFDIDLLSGRLIGAIDWLAAGAHTASLGVGLFGASTGAAAALRAAAERPDRVAAVVSRGGRPDLAMAALPRVHAPTLLIVGGRDAPVIEMNREAAAQLRTEHRIEIVPGATHLFEEPGALEQVARHARDWFQRHLAAVKRESRIEALKTWY